MEVRKMNNQKHILKQRWWALVLVVVGIVLYLWLDVSIFPKKAWEKAESENTIAAYEDLMKRYPEGPLADKARLKLEELHFEKAQTINTIPAYEDFLKRYPQGPVAAKARLGMEKLYNERNPAFRHTKTVKIMVEQSYGEAKGVSLPFEDIARRLCQYAGLQIVETDAKNYDVTLKIKTNGRALGALYKPGTFQYSGASLSGTISLEIPRIPAYEKSFKGYIKPPDWITYRYTNPSSAPFKTALWESGSFVTKIVEMMGEVYGINTMVTTLRDEELHVQNTAAEALGEIRDRRAVEPLITALKDKDPDVRATAAWAVGVISDRRALEPLITVLEDKNPNVRGNAAEALGEIGNSRAVEPLVAALLKYKESWILGDVTKALVKIGKPAIEPLIAALKYKKSHVREMAAEALGKIGDSRAVEPLIAALQDRDSSVREEVAEALKRITKQDFGQDHDAWLKWCQENKKKSQQQ